jgi:hypothetical protein
MLRRKKKITLLTLLYDSTIRKVNPSIRRWVLNLLRQKVLQYKQYYTRYFFVAHPSSGKADSDIFVVSNISIFGNYIQPCPSAALILAEKW